MKYLFSFIGALAMIIFQSVIASAFFTLCKWLLSLLGVCNGPSWIHFAGGGVVFFVLLFLNTVRKTCITLYRYHKDPEFKDVNTLTGLDWDAYKRLKNKN